MPKGVEGRAKAATHNTQDKGEAETVLPTSYMLSDVNEADTSDNNNARPHAVHLAVGDEWRGIIDDTAFVVKALIYIHPDSNPLHSV